MADVSMPGAGGQTTPTPSMPTQPMSGQPMGQPMTNQPVSGPVMPSPKKPTKPASNTLGTIAGWLAVAALAIFLIAALLDIEAIQPFPGVISVLLGIAALVTALIALIKYKTRSFFVYYALVIGVLSLALVIGEFFFFE